MRRSLGLALSVLVTTACTKSAPPASAPVGGGAMAATGVTTATGPALAWATLSAETFARARAEHRMVIIDGSAEWCHWCHVMDATTYRDPEVQRLIAERFIAVKVDIDAEPAFQERYEQWGWPATVFMTSEAAEIAKYRGYMPPAKFAEILRATTSNAVTPPLGSASTATAMQAASLTEPQLVAVAAVAQAQLDGLWDGRQGSWGEMQKVPLFWDNAWTLSQGRAGIAGNELARKRVLFTLDQQRKIIDPVWGGICQYSTDGDWLHPHFEKLAPYQAGAIDNYATAYGLTGDGAWLQTAERVRGFVDRFLTSPAGGFYTTMDADLNAHDPGKAFMNGHDYNAKSDAARVALGIPRVDTHEYGRDNGLLIAAYATLGQAGRDASAIAAAERAAARILETHANKLGGVTHDAGDDGRVLYLADNAALGFGLARLYEATHEPENLAAALRIADFLVAELQAPGGGFFASTPDPLAVGVLGARRRPFEDNVMAVRFLARLVPLADGAKSATYRHAIAGALAAVTTPPAIEDRGRMIGDLLLAIDESRPAR